jgi:hypothetical protein
VAGGAAAEFHQCPQLLLPPSVRGSLTILSAAFVLHSYQPERLLFCRSRHEALRPIARVPCPLSNISRVLFSNSASMTDSQRRWVVDGTYLYPRPTALVAISLSPLAASPVYGVICVSGHILSDGFRSAERRASLPVLTPKMLPLWMDGRYRHIYSIFVY